MLLQQLALTQKLRQNTSYLQLGGMNNWLYVYAVMTMFVEWFNIWRETVAFA